jgi:excisionase family DNA binding protein
MRRKTDRRVKRAKESAGARSSAVVPGEPLLSLKEVCERLGMTVHWGRKALARKVFLTVKLGRAVRIPASDLQRFIDERVRPAAKS